MQDTARLVADQYERHPYPALPWLASVSIAQAHTLSYELGQYLRTGRFIEHTRATRILVAGCGTFEAIVAARAHPQAHITGVDLSAKSLRMLKIRSWLAGAPRRISTVHADLHDDLLGKLGQFDYIICTGVIHHSPDPHTLVARLTALLNPNGILRLMTYAAHSRIWIYELQRFFRLLKTPANFQESSKVLNKLSSVHPLRSAFESYEDALNTPGLIDGFFHAFDRPLHVSRLRALASQNQLSLIGFGHAWHSQPNGFAAALKKAGLSEQTLTRYHKLDAWQRLELIDDCGELAVNPILWLSRNAENVEIRTPMQTKLNPPLRKAGSVRAPLLPTLGDELIATYYDKDVEQSADTTRLVVGGCLLGCDGRLPPELAANRDTSNTQKNAVDKAQESATSAFEFLPCFVLPSLQSAPVATANRLFSLNGRVLVPSAVRARAILQVREAAQTLGIREAAELSRLALALEPRINRQGHELAWLSTGDLLRDLEKRCGSRWAEAFWSFPLPPSDEQWRALLKEKTDATLVLLLEGGATQWFVPLEI